MAESKTAKGREVPKGTTVTSKKYEGFTAEERPP